METPSLTDDIIAAIIFIGAICIAVGGLGWNANAIHLLFFGEWLPVCSLFLLVAGLAAVAIGLLLRLRRKRKRRVPLRAREAVFGGINLAVVAAAAAVFLAAGWLLFIGIEGWIIAPCWEGLRHCLTFTHNATAAMATAYNDAVQVSSVLAVTGGAVCAGAGIGVLRREHPGLVTAALVYGCIVAVMLAYSLEHAVEVYTLQGCESRTQNVFAGTVWPALVFAAVALVLMAWQYREFQ